MSTTAQRTLRIAVQAVLEAAAGVTVQSPGDWETPSVNLPEIKLRCVGNRKSSLARQSANFTTTVALELLARVSAATAEDAQDAIEALLGQIEDSVLPLPTLWVQLQQITSVDTETNISANGSTHIGECRMTLQCETFEPFNPPDGIDLQQVLINVDLSNVYDPGNGVTTPLSVGDDVGDGLSVASGATGTYPSPPFPDSVIPAPRVQGPDGRNEGTVLIDLT